MPTLIPFDLERALAGEEVITREGREAKFVYRSPLHERRSLLFIISPGTDAEYDQWYWPNGTVDDDDEIIEHDLFMKPKTRTCYANISGSLKNYNIISSHIFFIESQAKERALVTKNFIKTIEFEIYE